MEHNLNNNDVFVAYRMPNAEHHYLLRPNKNKVLPFSALEEDTPAFVFYPFQENKKTPALAIPAHQVYVNPKFHFKSEHENRKQEQQVKNYIPLLERFIQHIETGKAHKIICSRIIHQEMKVDDLYPLFMRLKEEHPQVFIYIINIPNVGCWIGATPEVLFTHQNKVGETVALAGTRPLPNTEQWGKKETQEQQMVEQYIANILIQKKKSFQKIGPYSVQAGRIMHLKTRFRFPMSYQWKDIALDIHPSPAVCGLPKQTAKQFILENEPHDREYYCGFLGTVNIHNQTNLFVNLRCMKAFRNSFALYVGGGLTIDSIPQKELEETYWKSRTLSDILEKLYTETV